MSCDVAFTKQEIQELIDDQERIAAIIMLELSIEIEQAEMDWLSLEDFHNFNRGVAKANWPEPHTGLYSPSFYKGFEYAQ